tara:strand:+ start:106 stop:603 length:498 start_codon:yes stop_codon:yes gene_type:complete
MDKDKKERLDKVMNLLKQEKQDFDNFNKTLDTKQEDVQKAYDKVPLLFAEFGSFMMKNAKNPVHDLALYFGAMQMLFMVTPAIRRTAKIEGVELWSFFSLWQSYVYTNITQPQLRNLIKLINRKEGKNFKTIDEFNDWLDSQPKTPFAKDHRTDYHTSGKKGSVH